MEEKKLAQYPVVVVGKNRTRMTCEVLRHLQEHLKGVRPCYIIVSDHSMDGHVEAVEHFLENDLGLLPYSNHDGNYVISEVSDGRYGEGAAINTALETLEQMHLSEDSFFFCENDWILEKDIDVGRYAEILADGAFGALDFKHGLHSRDIRYKGECFLVRKGYGDDGRLYAAQIGPSMISAEVGCQSCGISHNVVQDITTLWDGQTYNVGRSWSLVVSPSVFATRDYLDVKVMPRFEGCPVGQVPDIPRYLYVRQGFEQRSAQTSIDDHGRYPIFRITIEDGKMVDVSYYYALEDWEIRVDFDLNGGQGTIPGSVIVDRTNYPYVTFTMPSLSSDWKKYHTNISASSVWLSPLGWSLSSAFDSRIYDSGESVSIDLGNVELLTDGHRYYFTLYMLWWKYVDVTFSTGVAAYDMTTRVAMRENEIPSTGIISLSIENNYIVPVAGHIGWKLNNNNYIFGNNLSIELTSYSACTLVALYAQNFNLQKVYYISISEEENTSLQSLGGNIYPTFKVGSRYYKISTSWTSGVPFRPYRIGSGTVGSTLYYYYCYRLESSSYFTPSSVAPSISFDTDYIYIAYRSVFTQDTNETRYETSGDLVYYKRRNAGATEYSAVALPVGNYYADYNAQRMLRIYDRDIYDSLVKVTIGSISSCNIYHAILRKRIGNKISSGLDYSYGSISSSSDQAIWYGVANPTVTAPSEIVEQHIADDIETTETYTFSRMLINTSNSYYNPTTIILASFGTQYITVEAQYTLTNRQERSMLAVIHYDTQGGLPMASRDVRRETEYSGSDLFPTLEDTADKVFHGWIWPEGSFSGSVSSTVRYTYTEPEVTVTASWINQVTVIFESPSGVEERTYTPGALYGSLPYPSWRGWVLKGWYKDANFSEVSKVTANSSVGETSHTLYANFEDPTTNCVVTFDANGGTSEIRQHVYSTGVELGWLPLAWRDGYVFGGWFDGQYRVETNYIFDNTETEVTLTAKWNAGENTYSSAEYRLEMSQSDPANFCALPLGGALRNLCELEMPASNIIVQQPIAHKYYRSSSSSNPYAALQFAFISGDFTWGSFTGLPGLIIYDVVRDTILKDIDYTLPSELSEHIIGHIKGASIVPVRFSYANIYCNFAIFLDNGHLESDDASDAALLSIVINGENGGVSVDSQYDVRFVSGTSCIVPQSGIYTQANAYAYSNFVSIAITGTYIKSTYGVFNDIAYEGTIHSVRMIGKVENESFTTPKLLVSGELNSVGGVACKNCAIITWNSNKVVTVTRPSFDRLITPNTYRNFVVIPAILKAVQNGDNVTWGNFDGRYIVSGAFTSLNGNSAYKNCVIVNGNTLTSIANEIPQGKGIKPGGLLISSNTLLYCDYAISAIPPLN